MESSKILLLFQTWGGLTSSYQFEVSLSEDGLLKAVVVGDEEGRKASITLSADETKAIHELALQAINEPNLTECDLIMDGTSGRLTVLVGSENITRGCSHTSGWPPEGSIASRLLAEIETRIPKEIWES